MFYFDGVLSRNSIADFFTTEFIQKIENGHSGLMIKQLKGHPHLLSLRFNKGNMRAFATLITHQGRKQLLLLDCFESHKAYDAQLKNKNLLQSYLKSLNITVSLAELNLDDDMQFEDVDDKMTEESIMTLLKRSDNK